MTVVNLTQKRCFSKKEKGYPHNFTRMESEDVEFIYVYEDWSTAIC